MASPCRTTSKTSFLMALAVCVLASSGAARADAVLASAKATLYPTRVALAVKVVAQVEVTEMRLTFPRVQHRASYVLTVPGPWDAYSMGVDLDRGQGFKSLGLVKEAPPAGAAGGSAANSDVAKWQGNTPLLADLADLTPGPLTVRIWFQRLLRRHKGKVNFVVGVKRCPLRPATVPDPVVTVELDCRTFRALSSFSAKGPGASIARPASNRAIVTLPPLTLTATADAAEISIAYGELSKGIHANFLAHRTPTSDPQGGTDGYFMLLLDADEIKVEDAMPRRLALVVDQSGSMHGSKIEQARAAASAMVANLREGDHFNIHTFNDNVHSFRPAAVPATAANLKSAQGVIEQLYAGGSTNLDGGIKAGLGGGGSVSDGGRFDAMILLSDGHPTAGETDPGRILKNAVAFNRLESRIYTFAVGSGADVKLMEALARGSRGRAFVLNNMQASQDLARKVKQLFEDIHAVRVADLSIHILGLNTTDVLPRREPDLFSGGQVIMVGRYQQAGKATARITGNANGKPYAHDVLVDAPAQHADNAFIKYVWATEMVGQLLADMVGRKDPAPWEEKIAKLGLAYRMQTPYTTFSSRGRSSATGTYPGFPGGYGEMDSGCDCTVGGSAGAAWTLMLLLMLLALRLRRR